MMVVYGINRQGLNMLRKKGKEEGNLPNDIPQGLNRLRKKSQESHFFSTGV